MVQSSAPALAGAPLPTSAILESLLADAPADQVGVGWLFQRLRDRSFGVGMLVVGLIAMLPGTSGLAAPVIALPALQMLLGYDEAALPGFVAARKLPAGALRDMLARALPVVRELERRLRPRWRTVALTRRLVGLVVLLLCVCLMAPIPFSQVPPAGIIALISFAYLQEDAVLVGVSALLALAALAGTLAAVLDLIGVLLA